MKIFKLIKGKIIALKLTAIVNSSIVLAISVDKSRYKITLPHKARTNSHGLDYCFYVHSLIEGKYVKIGMIVANGRFNKTYHGYFEMEYAKKIFWTDFKQYSTLNTNYHERLRRVNGWLNNYFNRIN